MNKTVPIILFSLLTSIILVWYLAHRNPNPKATISDDTIIVGTNAEYAPFSFMQDNTIIGFDIDLIHEIGNRLNKKIILQDMPFDALIPALQIGSIQVIATGITPTEQRAKQVFFTTPYLTGDSLVIVSKANNPLTVLNQLTGKKVAVNEGFTADYYMSNIKGPELIRFATAIESFMALESNRVDALVAAQNNVKPFLDKFGTNSLSVSVIPNTTEEYALAVSKKYPELRDEIDKIIAELTQDGTLEQLKKKWNL